MVDPSCRPQTPTYEVGVRQITKFKTRPQLHHVLKNGVPVTVVQSLLGHSSLEDTAVYLTIIQAEAAQMVRKVEW